MALLANMRGKRADDSEWVTVGEDDDPFDVQVRPFTSAYHDRLNELRRIAARQANRNRNIAAGLFSAEDLPPSVANKCEAHALAELILVDVRGLMDGDTPATVDQVRDLMVEPEYRSIAINVYLAAASITTARKDDREAAMGNSARASDGS